MAGSTEYDPVEVTPLQADEVGRRRDEALAAVEAAESLDALKQVRLAHAGDRSPLALANREIGALPPQARKEAGMRVGRARADVRAALDRRAGELEVAAEERMLVDEVVDVTATSGEGRTGSRHPLTTL